MNKIKYLSILAVAMFIFSCDDEDNDDNVALPTIYNFSNASYTSQTDRITQLEEMTNYAKSSITSSVDEGALIKMYQNEGGNGGGYLSFTSTKDLYSKTAQVAIEPMMQALDDVGSLFDDVNITAEKDVAGIISNGSSQYPVDEFGFEPIQMMDKGMMGAVFLDQISNVYLAPGKMNVDNTSSEEGTNYTSMEQHWDEAFGYFGAPVDYLDNRSAGVYWAKYALKMDSKATGGEYDLPKSIFEAYIEGRKAIVDGDYATRDAQIAKINAELEMVSAGTAIHYINSAINDFSNDGGRCHWLSEAYAFIWNLKFAKVGERQVTNAEIDSWLETLGKNYWTISSDDLMNLRQNIAVKYGFDNFYTQL